ncbi:hypothetical protein BH23BAC2_BH23BAC2_01680 [soil metagenome]
METPDLLTDTSQKNEIIAGSIHKDFDDLYIGEEMTFNIDHDPIDLYQQFQKKYQGQFIWNFIHNGPDLWFISIVKSG